MPGSPSLIINGINCEFFVPDDGSQVVSESYGPSGTSATMLIKCPWDSRNKVIEGLLGYDTSKGRVVTRNPPLEYPDSQGSIWVATAVNCTGLRYRTDQGTGFPKYDWAVLSTTFSVPSYDPSGDSDASKKKFITTTMRTSTEIFTPPTKATFFYNGNPAKPLENSKVGLLDTHVEIECVRPFYPYLFMRVAQDLAGKVNSKPMIFNDFTFTEKHVLFLEAEFTPTSEPSTGYRAWTATMRFVANTRHSWNEFLYSDGTYQEVSTDTSSGKAPIFPYESDDLLELFGDTW